MNNLVGFHQPSPALTWLSYESLLEIFPEGLFQLIRGKTRGDFSKHVAHVSRLREDQSLVIQLTVIVI